MKKKTVSKTTKNASDEFLNDPKSYVSILFEELRHMILLLTDVVKANTESIARLELKVDHVEQEIVGIKNDVSEIKETLATKTDAFRMKSDISKLTKEVFG